MSQHHKLPDDRKSITRRFSIPSTSEDQDLPNVLASALIEAFPTIDRELLGETLKRTLDHRTNGKFKFYVTAGMYEDGRIGELFVRADRAGSTMNGILDTLAMTMSIALQHGVPIEMLTAKMKNTQFPPYGLTGDSEFRICKSPIDLLAQWLSVRFGPKDEAPTLEAPPSSPPSPAPTSP